MIKNLVLFKKYSIRRLMKEFAQKCWNKNGLDALLCKICVTGAVDRQPRSGRPRSGRTAENTDTVQCTVCTILR